MPELIERHVTPREGTILILAYGLDGRGPRTLQEIAHRLGVSRERVRQLRNRALATVELQPARSAPPAPASLTLPGASPAGLASPQRADRHPGEGAVAELVNLLLPSPTEAQPPEDSSGPQITLDFPCSRPVR